MDEYEDDENVIEMPAGRTVHIDREELIEIIGEIAQRVIEANIVNIVDQIEDELEEELEHYQ